VEREELPQQKRKKKKKKRELWRWRNPRSFLCNTTPELLVVLPETENFKHSFLAGG
jgi:hypothetical protein